MCQKHPQPRGPGRRCRGLTLMESMMASAILAGAVVTVIFAITAGQQHAYQAKEQIAASLAAEEVLGDIIKKPHNQIESSGGFIVVNGFPVLITTTPAPDSDKVLADINVRVLGIDVTLQVLTPDWSRTVTEVTHFVPGPPS